MSKFQVDNRMGHSPGCGYADRDHIHPCIMIGEWVPDVDGNPIRVGTLVERVKERPGHISRVRVVQPKGPALMEVPVIWLEGLAGCYVADQWRVLTADDLHRPPTRDVELRVTVHDPERPNPYADSDPYSTNDRQWRAAVAGLLMDEMGDHEGGFTVEVMSDVMCAHCGLVALTQEGGSPVKVEQHEHAPRFEYGSIAGIERFPTFGASYCSLRCASDALRKADQ